MITYTPTMMDDSLARLERGEVIVCNAVWHDAMIDYLKDEDSERASRFFRNCATWPNPKGVGTLDTMLASYNREAIRAARVVMYGQEGADSFELANDPPKPKHKRGEFHGQENTLQKVLIDGLDCLPGQQDLF